MEGKQQIINGLTNIYNRWQDLISKLSEEQISSALVPSDWTIKDVIAHLWSWQQASVARMEAALEDIEPDYPEWWKINGPDPEEDINRTNAWLYVANRNKPWSKVVADWKNQFERYVELTRQIPEDDLLELGRYPWMGKNALSASSMGSLEHHEEHYDTLSAWLDEHGQD
jgi:hypothetical protein